MTIKEQCEWWIKQNENVEIQDRILNEHRPIRGVYGIFVMKGDKWECAYIGRAYCIYEIFFGYRGHISKMMSDDFPIPKIKEALNNRTQIYVKILEDVPFIKDDYYKDMQRLAYAECRLITEFQEKNQCL